MARKRRVRCLPLFFRHLIISCFAFQCSSRVIFLDSPACSWDINYRGVHFCPKWWFLQGNVVSCSEASTNEGRNGLKFFGCIGISRMPNHIISFQLCVWLDFTLSTYLLNRLAFFFFFSQQKPRKATPQPGEDTLNGHLPPGWQSYMSPQGRRYYVNTFTNGKWGWLSSKCFTTCSAWICFRKSSC